MATKVPTPILLDTDILSKIITNVLDEVGVAATRKSACLNRAAALIAGPKHNWGYLTGLDLPFAAQTLSSAYRITPAADAQNHLTEPAGGILTAPPRHEAFGDLHEDLRPEDKADDADDRPILSASSLSEMRSSPVNQGWIVMAKIVMMARQSNGGPDGHDERLNSRSHEGLGRRARPRGQLQQRQRLRSASDPA